MNQNLDTRIQTMASWLYEASYPVVFTGAGISTGSGLPDFRGPDGVWTRRDKGLPPKPMTVPWEQVNPNPGHYALVDLLKLGKLRFLISQNVDNLHRSSSLRTWTTSTANRGSRRSCLPNSTAISPGCGVKSAGRPRHDLRAANVAPAGGNRGVPPGTGSHALLRSLPKERSVYCPGLQPGRDPGRGHAQGGTEGGCETGDCESGGDPVRPGGPPEVSGRYQ